MRSRRYTSPEERTAEVFRKLRREQRRLIGPGSWWSIGHVVEDARLDPQVEWHAYLDGFVITGPVV